MILMFTVGLVAGLLMATIITNVIWISRTTKGTLKIDQTNPNKDIYRFEVKDLDVLSKKKAILIKIDKVSQR